MFCKQGYNTYEKHSEIIYSCKVVELSQLIFTTLILLSLNSLIGQIYPQFNENLISYNRLTFGNFFFGETGS